VIPERLAHGFEKEEFETRTLKAQRLMRLGEMDSLLLTTEPEVRYFSGFHTPFWQSPTRPWYLVVPLEGKPIAVIPEIGAERMASTWIDKIETWASPRPKDEGLTELSNILKDIDRKFGRVGLPMGAETHVRMPFLDFSKLTQLISGLEFVDGSPIVSKLRMIKSESEISKTRFICQCVSQSFQNMKKLAKQGDKEREIFRKFKIDILSNGADEVPYLVGGSGANGPEEVIGMPSDRVMGEGDVLMMDTGAVFDGYYSDFDRNFGFGSVSEAAQSAYRKVYNATEVGLRLVRPGMTAEELWCEMANVLNLDQGSGSVGRLGHGLGMQLTEWPSHMPGDKTVLKEGMVLTLEPSLTFDKKKIMVLEENIVVRDGPAELLTCRAPEEIPVIY
tara:strand:+ start:27 stop:1196 length:1170 start_codon:yes stop_codon:yes gene_type:complete